jgi:hypothetical protein
VSGASSKKNHGFCSSKCREAAKKAPRSVARKCQHGRQKHKCKDCGTGYCDHGRQKDKCRDCGTGYCDHGRQERQYKDCGTGYCDHGCRKIQCKDCGTGCGAGKKMLNATSCAIGVGYIQLRLAKQSRVFLPACLSRSVPTPLTAEWEQQVQSRQA